MHKLLTSAILAVSLSSVSSAQQAKEYKFRPIKINETDKGSLYTISVEVEGKTTNFLLDSGSPRGLIYDVRIPKALKRKVTPLGSQLSGAGGKVTAWHTTINKTTIAKLIGYGLQKKALVTKVTNLEKHTLNGKPAHISGIVGAPVMSKMRGIFDYTIPRLLIPTSNTPKGVYKKSILSKGGHAVPITITDKGIPYVTLTMKGKTYAFMIDTGANSNIFLPGVIKELGLKLTDHEITIQGLGEKTNKAQYVQVSKPVLGGKLRVPQITAVAFDLGNKVESQNGIKAGGILGTTFMKSIRAQLDFDSSSLLIPATK